MDRLIAADAEVLEDRHGELTFKDVRGDDRGWSRGPEGAFLFGSSQSTYWARWRVSNHQDHERPLVLDLGTSLQDYVEWYVLRNGEARLAHFASGDRRPYGERPDPRIRNLVLPLTLAGRESADVFVRFSNHDGLHEAMPVRLLDRETFLAGVERRSLLLTLYHGGLLALALYNLLLFFATRERGFGLYVGYVTSLLFWSVTFTGYGFQHFWPNAPTFNNNALTASAACSFGLFALFAVEYLNLRDSTPRWVMRTNQVLAWVCLAALVPAALDHYALGGTMINLAGLATMAVALSTGLWLLLQGQRQARFFMAAFVVLGVGATASVLQIMSLVPSNVLTMWGVQIGSSIEVLVLGLGLADAMNALKAQKLNAERESRRAQEVLNSKLEQLVDERTRALEDANTRLHALAVTDELTGAYNRRHFNGFLTAALASEGRGEPLALCMFDLDKFKSYNDHYGHQAGDEVLRTIASEVQSALRRSGDALVRLGGEEFGVVFSARSARHAYEFADRLRLVVRNLRIPHARNPGGIVTASFGVCWCDNPASHTADSFYELADRQLYAAKAAGRDVVCIDGGDERTSSAAV